METITNAASTVAATASKAIWGEQNATKGNETAGNEPISGEQGKGTPSDPYDQGNVDSTSATTKSNPTSTLDSTTDTASGTKATPNIPMNNDSAATGGAPKPLEDTDKTGVTSSTLGNPTKGSDVIPSESSNNPGVAPESGAAPTHKQQGADKPQDAPTDKSEGAIKDTKDDTERELPPRDPNDHSGEPMKMHNGPEKVPKSQEERRESKVGMPGGQEHGKEEHGTGEEWVKTSGLHADGGDFDATKPGAGREADRLLEQKGVKRSDDKSDKSHSSPPPASGSGSGEKEKVPLGEKIKAKLHIGHKDK